MATKQSTIDFIVDQAGMGSALTFRKMFGEYALYVSGKVVALVCDDTLFVKITPAGRAHVGDTYKEGAPYPGAKPAMEIDGDTLERGAWLQGLLQKTADALPVPKPKAKRKK